MTDPTDKELDTWLEGESDLSRAYRGLDHDRPSADLDRHILTAARDAVGADVVRLQRWRRWTVPVALAAGVVVAVPLAVRVFDSSPPPLADRDPAPVASHRTIPSADHETLMLPDDTAVEAANNAPLDMPPAATKQLADPSPEAQRPALLREFRSDDRATDAYNRSAAPVAAAGERGELHDSPGRSDQSASADSAPFASRPAPGNGALARQPVTSPAGGTDAAIGAAPTLKSETARLSVADRDPRRWLSDIARLHDSGDIVAARQSLGAFLEAHPQFPLPQAFPLRRDDALYDAAIVQRAETWLSGIAQLAADGRIDAARQQLAAFLERYPGYPLPADFPLERDDARPIEQ